MAVELNMKEMLEGKPGRHQDWG